MSDRHPFPYPSRRMPVYAKNVVAASQPLAAQAGLEMIRRGGNAVDAALATAITLTVVEPTSNGIGGDVFAMVWDGQQLYGLNGSGRSPRSWSPHRFSRKRAIPLLGWDAVTVPGAVDAWARLSERFGKLPFDTLFEAAIRYARDGFPVSPKTAFRWKEAAGTYKGFPEFVKTFLPKRRPPKAGEHFSCADQARTLEEIAKTGGASFYRGKLAERIIAHAEETGGSLTADDLAEHRSEWVNPISQGYHGVEVHEIPPNGQGLVALLALGLLAHHDIREYPMDSANALHLQVEAVKIAFSEALHHIGDLAGMVIAPEGLLKRSFLARRAREIRIDQAQFPEASIPLERGTVYLAAADQGGMMVSFIQSNYLGFGSGIVVPGTGISLHNRGAGFTLQAGHPNQVDGGKRPFHTIVPGFVTSKGEPVMAFGVMGGHMQPQGHVQMITRIFDYGLNPQEASDAPRWYVTPDFGLAVERGFNPIELLDLEERGHFITREAPVQLFGGAQLIMRAGGGYCAASDHRKDGQAVGF